MRTLIHNCSPVRGGATVFIAETAAQVLSARGEVRSVCIDDYPIAFCRGCRSCHTATRCGIQDGVDELMAEFAHADTIVCVSPSYWADVPGQFKAFIDRCTPWCDTHEPHAAIPAGKKGYVIALRTGPGMPEIERIFRTVEHFYGHLGIERCGTLGLCGVEDREAAARRKDEIVRFCEHI